MAHMRPCPACGETPLAEATRCARCDESLLSVTPGSLLRNTSVARATVPAAHQPLTPHAVLAGRYRILRALKSGGMGSVYLASDSHLGGRLCAIKEMLDRFPSEEARLDGQLWFAREAQMLGRLRHGCIPEIYDYFIEGGRFYLSLEYIEGENLEDRVGRLGTPGLPEVQVLGWAAQICEVLQYLHDCKPPIIFRDLKPANVMLTGDGAIRLVDFGIARVFSAVRQNTMIGTPGYCPPEQYQGMAEQRSDLYSLAASVHHLLSGRDPRDSAPFSFPLLRGLAPHVSEATERLIAGALTIELSDRGPAIPDFARQLRRIESELAQGLQPAIGGSMGLHAPGDPLPPTRVVAPFGGASFGRLAIGQQHTVSIPINNEGPHELRAVLRSNARWLVVPEGQLRVPCGSTVRVPLRIDTSGVPAGSHQAKVTFDGNGGTVVVPVEVRLVNWLNSGSVALLGATLAFAAILALIAHFAIVHP